MALSIRQQKFAQGFADGKSATQAYSDAGYKSTGASAATASSRLLMNVEVSALVEELRAASVAKAEITAEEVVERLAKIARNENHRQQIKALQLLGLKFGMFTMNTKHSGRIETDDSAALEQLTDDELRTIRDIQERAAERAGNQRPALPA